MLNEFRIVNNIWSAKGDIITPFCYKFIQVTACKNWLTRPQLNSVIAKPSRVRFLMPRSVFCCCFLILPKLKGSSKIYS